MPKPRIARAQDVQARATRIADFHPALRPTVRRLIDQSPRVADLRQSFPALLAALAGATDCRGLRSELLRRIDQGASVFEVAADAGFKRWWRFIAVQAIRGTSCAIGIVYIGQELHFVAEKAERVTHLGYLGAFPLNHCPGDDWIDFLGRLGLSQQLRVLRPARR